MRIPALGLLLASTLGACAGDTVDGTGGTGGSGGGGGGSGGGGVVDCGNGQRDSGEACEGEDVGTATCADFGYRGGSVTCTDACALDPSGCILPDCGDGLVVGAEECDGTELGDATCVGLGLPDGPISCDVLCLLDTSLCGTGGPVCGDGIREAPESCDGDDVGGLDCTAYGFDEGPLGCVACRPSFALCILSPPVCGDGVAEGLEACDGGDARGQDCGSLALGTGTLGCAPGCNALDLAGCDQAPRCGDGTAQALEACDGGDVRAQTCDSLAYGTGDLGCDPSCLAYDFSGCSEPPQCGDGVLEGDEVCDGPDLGGRTCENVGLGAGLLACVPGCGRLDPSGCDGAPSCGDDTAEGLEVCDGIDLRGADLCEAYGYDPGTAPACMSTCLLQDLSGCGPHATCGDPATGPFAGKQCDGLELYLATCESLGFAGGTLGCNVNCSFDVSGCT